MAMLVALGLAFFATWSARAAESWVLLPAPKFMGHEVTRPIAGAKSTVLAVAKFGAYGIEFPTGAEWQALGIADETLTELAAAQAAAWLKELTPDLVRDAQKVVRYAVLRSEQWPIAATVLVPEFWRRFEPFFGAKMKVAMPNRYTVYVFPDLGEDLQEHVPMVIQAWRSRHPKVSLEVFELSEKGMQAVGSFEEP